MKRILSVGCMLVFTLALLSGEAAARVSVQSLTKASSSRDGSTVGNGRKLLDDATGDASQNGGTTIGTGVAGGDKMFQANGGDGGNGGDKQNGKDNGEGTGGKIGGRECRNNQYRLKSDNNCIDCVSPKSAALEDLNGRMCYKPFARKGPETCDFGTLPGIQYSNPNLNCFKHTDGQKFNGSVLLPSPGTFNFFGRPVTKYNFEGMDLNDYRATEGRTKNVDGVRYVEATFKSNRPVTLKGGTLFLNGIVISGGLPVCFSVEGQVCSK